MMPISVVASLVIALAGTGAFAWYQDEQVDSLREQKSKLETTLGTVGAQLKEQNDAVLALKAAADKQETLAREAAKRAAALLASSNAKVLKLQKAPVPADCSGALEWLRLETLVIGGAQ